MYWNSIERNYCRKNLSFDKQNEELKVLKQKVGPFVLKTAYDKLNAYWTSGELT